MEGKTKMKYLHILPPSKRMMETYIKMIRENFDLDEHHFYFIVKCPESEESLFEYKNVYQMNGRGTIEKIFDFYKHLNEAEQIVWHGFLYPTRFMIFLYVFRKFLKKSIWIMWGIDLYNWKREENSIKDKIINHVNKVCKQTIPKVVALLCVDKEHFKKEFSNSKAQVYTIPYPISKESFKIMDNLKEWKKRENGKIFIQVAHNAHQFNNHLEILEALKNYNEENIRLYIPFSYGNDWHSGKANYKNDVRKKADEYFGSKAIFLARLIDQQQYTKFLWNIDIAIFNSERQNALGNILKLLYMGNKVYLSPKSPLYSFFKDLGIEIFNTEDIKDISYEEFIEAPNQRKAIEWIRDYYYPNAAAPKWRQLFDGVEACSISEDIDYIYDIAETKELHKLLPKKDNYMSLERYFTTNPKAIKKLNEMKELVIIGGGTSAREVLQYVFCINKSQVRWFIKGFLDNHIETMGELPGDLDIIGVVDTWEPDLQREEFICAIDSPAEKEELVVKIKEKGVIFADMHSCATIGYNTNIGIGCIFTSHTIILVNSNIGDFVYIKESRIGSNVQIGDYTTIGAQCSIGNDVYIGKRVVIGDNVVVYPGIFIDDDVFIESGSVIKKDIGIKLEQLERNIV